LYFLYGLGESIVGVSDEHGRLGLGAVRVNIVPVTEAVGIIETNHGLPLFFVIDLKLDRVLENAFAPANVGTTHARLSGHQFQHPFAIDFTGLGHAHAPLPYFGLTGYQYFLAGL
jgi:hypothetical protein